jgi:hypothetical protein
MKSSADPEAQPVIETPCATLTQLTYLFLLVRSTSPTRHFEKLEE